MLSIAKNFVYRPINPYFRQGSANLSLVIASSDPPNRVTSFFFFFIGKQTPGLWRGLQKSNVYTFSRRYIVMERSTTFGVGS